MEKKYFCHINQETKSIMEKQIATFKDYAIFMADKTSLLEIAQFVVKENYSHHLSSFTEIISPQFRSIILCDLLLYIDVTFWYLSIDLGFFWGSWFLHRHKIPHPNPMGDMISTKKYCLFKEYFRIVCLICI